MKYLRTNSLKRLFSLKRRAFDEDVSAISSPHESIEDDNNNEGSFRITKSSSPRPTWRCFSFEEISAATNGFSPENLVGRGGYAEVYKGVLQDGEEIAVKRLTKCSTDDRKEKDFLTEIGTIGHVSHPNVLSLLGCFGTARGLNYLHKGCQRRIIHRDIKSSNILLTEDFEPQISDFGLAKWLPSQWSHHSIAPIEGTFGHLAPEYFMHGIVDEKTDVFAFGVFLLEIISGRKPVDGSHLSLHSWAKPILNQGELDKLVDPRLQGTYDVTQLNKLAFAASLCIRASPTWRPTMSEVLKVMTEEEIDKERWKMPEKEEEDQQEFWGFEDLEYECDTSFSISTGSS
ncbi:hypothetical protein Pint_14105 [Pistacia integerrima]|uniref:Uncharacterized protein n=1 Tax=Pistacia integerrima TaxID=434235 RepID=A0ACC0Y5U7_9ROSI|nr:hypothetical protein Pint_14105 [Pistacia integerrima]